ncbi:MAG: RluA family pseudouridine synthase [Burkholderiales bacterium]
MKGLSKDSVTRLTLGEEVAGQRIDNFLVRLLKGVPKSHVYRILRSGEVRVNSGRAAPTRRLAAGDEIRIPPIRIAERPAVPSASARSLEPIPVLFEDGNILAIDKPAGLAVHGGSGISHGVIERLRAERPAAKFLELVHRLDRETSGVLLLAKKRAALVNLHEQIRDGATDKRYLALVKGAWDQDRITVNAPLAKYVLEGGDRRVSVEAGGQPAKTALRRLALHDGCTLVEARLLTGRTHQIRVHLAHLGLPICGDDKYGDFAFNRLLARRGLKRMFLHAARFTFRHPDSGEPVTISADLPGELSRFLESLDTPADTAGGAEAS